jgi:hypothetical protein
MVFVMARLETGPVTWQPLKGCILSRLSQGKLSGSSPLRSGGSHDSQDRNERESGIGRFSPHTSYCVKGEGGTRQSTWTHISPGRGSYLSSGIHEWKRISNDFLSKRYIVNQIIL